MAGTCCIEYIFANVSFTETGIIVRRCADDTMIDGAAIPVQIPADQVDAGANSGKAVPQDTVAVEIHSEYHIISHFPVFIRDNTADDRNSIVRKAIGIEQIAFIVGCAVEFTAVGIIDSVTHHVTASLLVGAIAEVCW